MMLEHFIPSLHLHTIYDLDLDHLQRQGIKGVITNLDNTLVEQDRSSANDKLSSWLQNIRDRELKVVIVSNNKELRVASFARPLGIPFVYEARKPWGHPFSRALKLLHTTSRDTVVIGDQLLTDIVGGNRHGFYTVWVDPISEHAGWPTKINRFLERQIYSYLKKKGYMPWDDHR